MTNPTQSQTSPAALVIYSLNCLSPALGPCRRPRAACVTGAAHFRPGAQSRLGVESELGVGLVQTRPMAATTTSAATTISESATTTSSSADAKPAEAGPTVQGASALPLRPADVRVPARRCAEFHVRAQIVVQRVASARLRLDSVSECEGLLSALPSPCGSVAKEAPCSTHRPRLPGGRGCYRSPKPTVTGMTEAAAWGAAASPRSETARSEVARLPPPAPPAQCPPESD